MQTSSSFEPEAAYVVAGTHVSSDAFEPLGAL